MRGLSTRLVGDRLNLSAFPAVLVVRPVPLDSRDESSDC